MASSRSILVVDSDATARHTITEAIKEEGYIVHESSSGIDALKIAEQVQPDLIIIDAIMPRIDGISVCRYIRNASWGKNMPIAIVVSLDDKATIKQAEIAGATDLLIKPINPDILKYRIRFMIKTNEVYYQTGLEQQEFKSVLEKIPDPLVVYNHQGKVLWANDSSKNFFAAPASRFLTKTCASLCLDSFAECDACIMQQTLKSGRVLTGVKHNIDGTVWGMRTFPIIDDLGECSKVVKLCHDITEKVKLQADAAYAGQMVAIGELAAGIAHEINNPANGIINCSQLGMNSLSANQQEHQLFSRINQEAERISAIVKNLMELSWTGEKSGFTHEELSKLVSDPLELMDEKLAKDSIATEFMLAAPLGTVNIKKHAITLAIHNIIENARYALNAKYGAAKNVKTLEISSGTTILNRDAYAHIKIKDNGTGIAAKHLELVKLPFFSTKPAGSGTGVGLSISHKIIKEHDGELWIESCEGEGTTVHILLPIGESDDS